jgi:nucleotide-binding universal stress UspA family protein
MRSIIVPLDGSPTAERALAPARAFAARAGANVILLTGAATHPDNARAHAYLEEQVAKLQKFGGPIPTVETEVISGGTPAEAICGLVRDTPGAVVCMATHGRGRSAAVLGSVAQDVVRTAAAPVLLIGPENELGSWLPDPAHVVACIDGSDVSQTAVEPAVELALEVRADINVVRVLEPVLALVPSLVPSSPTEPELPALEATAKKIANLGVPASYALLRPEDPADAITRLAREDAGTACIALATHGRTGMARVFLGSVAQRVVRHAPCPVLVHRPVIRRLRADA